MNHPETPEGWQVWNLVSRLGGQTRMVAGGSGALILGWDLGAALALARALGVPRHLAADALPALEAVMVRQANAQIAAQEARDG